MDKIKFENKHEEVGKEFDMTYTSDEEENKNDDGNMNK